MPQLGNTGNSEKSYFNDKNYYFMVLSTQSYTKKYIEYYFCFKIKLIGNFPSGGKKNRNFCHARGTKARGLNKIEQSC